MRTFGTRLCLFLLIPIGSLLCRDPRRSETPVRIALSQALREATELYQKREHEAAAASFAHTSGRAAAAGEKDLAALGQVGLGNCRFAQRRYDEALRIYLDTRKVFEALGNRERLASLDASLASLYTNLGEFDAAVEAAKHSLASVIANDFKGFRAHLEAELGVLLARQGRMQEAVAHFSEAIFRADLAGDLELCANAWSWLGNEYLVRKQYPEAEEAMLEEFRLRTLHHLPAIEVSYRSLGVLRLEQGDLRSAEALLDRAVASSQSSRVRVPKWFFYHARGRLRAAQGRMEGALKDFRMALELARDYRASVPPSDATRISADGMVYEAYASLIDAATRLYFVTGRREAAEEAFEAAEENRSVSLRARIREKNEWRRNLPPDYWHKASLLEAAEVRLLDGGGDDARSEIRRLRTSLLEIESQAGSNRIEEATGLTERVRAALDNDALLLSFHLAEPQSCLWALHRGGLSLYKLPGKSEIERDVRLFVQAVQGGSAEVDRLGRELATKLLGGLTPAERRKTRWLLSLDDALFELPFAALIEPGGGRVPRYLVEEHAIQITSGAMAWESRRKAERRRRYGGRFLGVGDAIYNMADARWGPRSLLPISGWTTTVSASSALTLNRLAGSGREIEACAAAWRGTPTLLLGTEVHKDRVRGAIAQRPSVVHFATHVVRGPEPAGNALIALGLAAGQSEFLSPDEISGWQVDAGLVVLSGCSSGLARAIPGAGLMGLTRAWLMAGADSVLASFWPTSDDSGALFLPLYRELQRSTDPDSAQALRLAQREMLRSNGWRAKPTHWAAYFILGNY